MLLEQMALKFGELPPDTIDRVQRSDYAQLGVYIERLLHTDAVADLLAD